MVEPAFYSDKDVARILNISPTWVRQQRFRRAHKLPNGFDLEPCRIGGCVRYVADEVHALVAAYKGGGR